MEKCKFCKILSSDKEKVDEVIVFENEQYIGLIDKYRRPSIGRICPFVREEYGTYVRNIEGSVEHSYYHIGQTSLLLKLVDPVPPPS